MNDERFEEKQYEQAANIELALRHPNVFSAGQVLESIVGYDVAAHQNTTSPIWRILQVNPRSGLALIPNLWNRAAAQPPAAKLPTRLVSLLLQYKRPEYLTMWKANQWTYWQRPYFRFSLLRHQQQILEAFERSVNQHAIVRYSSPAFWRYVDLENFQAQRQVLDNSNFVRPRRLNGHSCWTYLSPGIRGYANPDGEEIESETFEQVFRELTNLAKSKTNLIEHIKAIRGFMERNGDSQLTFDFDEPGEYDFPDIDNDQSAALKNLEYICRAVSYAGVAWFVVQFE